MKLPGNYVVLLSLLHILFLSRIVKSTDNYIEFFMIQMLITLVVSLDFIWLNAFIYRYKHWLQFSRNNSTKKFGSERINLESNSKSLRFYAVKKDITIL